MIFEAKGLDALRKEMEAFKTAQREMANSKEVSANAGQKAAETAKREMEATKEAARQRTVANEQARIESTRAERDMRRRAAAERAMADEMRRARARDVTATREQIRIEETKRAAQAKAAREERLAYLERRRLVQAEHYQKMAAERSLAAERQRADERIAASIAKRSGRSQTDIMREIQAQRELGRAAETAGQQATRAESRWRRLGQTIRGIRWGRVAGEAMVDLSKNISKTVADGVAKGLRDGGGRVQSLMNGGPGGSRPGGAASAAIKELSWNTIVGAVSDKQAALTTTNQMIGPYSADQARAAVAAAEQAHAETARRTPLAEYLNAAREVSTAGVIADKGLIKEMADAAFANGLDVTDIAREYADALKRKDAGGFALRMGATTALGDDGSQTVRFQRDGQLIERQLTPGSEAAIMRELMGRHAGAIARYAATPQGIWDTALTQGRANAATAMEEPFRKATEWMQRFNDAMSGFDGGAAGFGKKIADGMDQAEKLVMSISTNISAMVGPVHQVVEGLGGWKTVVGGLVVLNIAGWLGGAAAGIRAVAGASSLLAASPAGRALVGLGLAAYALNEAWTTDKPEPGSLKANARAEVQAIKDAVASAWRWANTPLNRPAAPAGPAAEVAMPLGPGAEMKGTDASSAAREALALMAQVPPAAQAMAGEVTAILAAQNFHAQGVAMMETLAEGIRAGAASAIGAVREVTQAMRDHLPHSPAKVGPLSDLDRVRFSETLAAAIRPDPAVSAVRAVAAGMLGALPASGAMAVGSGDVPAISRPVGGGASVTYAPVIHIGAGADPAEFRAQLEQHKHELVKLLEEAQARRSDLRFD
ncbi:MAG: hypothetical protein DI527_16440 [Chelatococcus sp.]|nr:MAG: hypothetical protein DI527_16440 [Chelatococcus sp.]